jgi:acetyltransferase-like isoleucine patch superfamily enzyme
MKLSEVPDALGISIVRDGDFENLGFLFDGLPVKLIFVESQRYVASALRSEGVSAVLTTENLVPAFTRVRGIAVASAPRATFFRLQSYLVSEATFYGGDCPSRIHPGARIHRRAWVDEHNVCIGGGTIMEANAVVQGRVVIGSRVRVRAGAVLGSEGFQYARDGDNVLQLAHAGAIQVDDDVEIFSNAVIARAVFRQSTRIGRFSRVGNGCFVSHNVQLGRRCFVGHGAVINGNAVIGDDAWIGPNATIANLVTIGAEARITMGAAVIQSVPPGGHVTGPTAIEHTKMLRHTASIR